MDQGQPGKHVKGPADSERRCVATRLSLPASDLIRFVAGPEGTLVPDIRRKLPGRGVWTALSREAVIQAVKTKAFARSLKSSVQVSDNLADQVEALLERDALQSLSIANKAGLVTTGFAKIEALIGGNGVAALIEASDGADDGRRKLMQALRRRYGERAASIPIADCFQARDLALAFGRDLVIHAALSNGAATGGFLDRWRRFTQFRTRPLPKGAPPADASELHNVDEDEAGPTSE